MDGSQNKDKKERKMVVKILGPGCVRCHETERLIKEAVTENQVDAQVEKVTDIKEIAKYGVLSVPAVVIDGRIKCVGRIPKKQEILSWLDI
jgi:small redox-active disulfide protein 2